MKWVIVTSHASEHIIPAQKHLFEKYAPGQELVYVSTGRAPLQDWCRSVLMGIGDIKDEYVVFGLDDYLPIGPLNLDRLTWVALWYGNALPGNFNRVGIGWGDSRKKDAESYNDDLFRYTPETTYSCSCQFAVWRTQALRDMLATINHSPWTFEVKGELKEAYALKEPIFRWIEESALSGRQPGKINLLGMRPADVRELIDLKLIDESKIIYGWKGTSKFTADLPGPKYQEFYETT